MATNTYMVSTSNAARSSIAYTETQTNKTYMVAGAGAITETPGVGGTGGTGGNTQVFVAT